MSGSESISMRNRLWISLGAAIVIAVGLYLVYGALQQSSAPPAPIEAQKAENSTAPTSQVASKLPEPSGTPGLTPPSFDVVRVEPDGSLVVGGRAQPSSDVTLLVDGKAHDKVASGSNGQFAMVPPPLKPGPHSLTLSMAMKDGRVVGSSQNVSVDVPENKKDAVLVAKTDAGKGTEVLSAPAASQPAVASSDGRPMAAITVVEAEEGGTLYVAGKAAPGANVRLYLNESYLGAADVGSDSSWSLKIAKGVVPGQYHVRADDADPVTGKVLSRAEVTFDYEAKVAETAPAAASPKPQASVTVDTIETTTVSRGDSLWRISRKTYGAGNRYTVIHSANKEQIRDPDLIYPGQIFVLPKL
jgi:nucleoid-associated protein YgaU